MSYKRGQRSLEMYTYCHTARGKHKITVLVIIKKDINATNLISN